MRPSLRVSGRAHSGQLARGRRRGGKWANSDTRRGSPSTRTHVSACSTMIEWCRCVSELASASLDSAAPPSVRCTMIEYRLPRVTEVRHVREHRVWVRFDDGLSGDIDLGDDLTGTMFAPLRDSSFFAKV